MRHKSISNKIARFISQLPKCQGIGAKLNRQIGALFLGTHSLRGLVTQVSRRFGCSICRTVLASIGMITPERQHYNLPIRVKRCLVRGKPKGPIERRYRDLSVPRRDVCEKKSDASSASPDARCNWARASEL